MQKPGSGQDSASTVGELWPGDGATVVRDHADPSHVQASMRASRMGSTPTQNDAEAHDRSTTGLAGAVTGDHAEPSHRYARSSGGCQLPAIVEPSSRQLPAPVHDTARPPGDAPVG